MSNAAALLPVNYPITDHVWLVVSLTMERTPNRTSRVAELLGIKFDTAKKHLERLVDIGVGEWRIVDGYAHPFFVLTLLHPDTYKDLSRDE